jgi:toxin ParE1/3/4
MRLLLSDKARAGYLEERSLGAASTFIKRINANFENLVRFPFIGRERSNLAPGLRCLVVGLHLLFYTIETDEIMVVRVIDGRMDVDEEFYR